ncbi:MAG: HD domain-containing protein [Neisseria sp.]|nr:HD domain-containing protein [Neisseria sp.]
MATLEKAIELAARYHAGQTDKGGSPYILHPLRVMMAVADERAKMAAVMHDLIEDTPLTAADLREHGFEEAVVEAVIALTKKRGENRIEAAHRAAANPIARQVKLADVADNMDLSRLPVVSEKDLDRMAQYREVLQILQAAEAEAV